MPSCAIGYNPDPAGFLILHHFAATTGVVDGLLLLFFF